MANKIGVCEEINDEIVNCEERQDKEEVKSYEKIPKNYGIVKDQRKDQEWRSDKGWLNDEEWWQSGFFPRVLGIVLEGNYVA